MLGLTAGELFVVVFVTIAVVSASLWPRAGEALAILFSGRRSGSGTPPSADRSAPDENGEESR